MRRSSKHNISNPVYTTLGNQNYDHICVLHFIPSQHRLIRHKYCVYCSTTSVLCDSSPWFGLTLLPISESPNVHWLPKFAPLQGSAAKKGIFKSTLDGHYSMAVAVDTLTVVAVAESGARANENTANKYGRIMDEGKSVTFTIENNKSEQLLQGVQSVHAVAPWLLEMQHAITVTIVRFSEIFLMIRRVLCCRISAQSRWSKLQIEQ